VQRKLQGRKEMDFPPSALELSQPPRGVDAIGHAYNEDSHGNLDDLSRCLGKRGTRILSAEVPTRARHRVRGHSSAELTVIDEERERAPQVDSIWGITDYAAVVLAHVPSEKTIARSMSQYGRATAEVLAHLSGRRFTDHLWNSGRKGER